MTKTEILNYLELINDETTDAYHLTDSMNNPDALSSIDTAQGLVDELRNNLEGKFENGSEVIAADGLPLNFPYHNDGEGRLKGNN